MIQWILRIPNREERLQILSVLYLELLSGEKTLLSFKEGSGEDVNQLMMYTESELLMIKRSGQDAGVDLHSLWIACLNQIDEFEESAKELLEAMITLIDCGEQLQLDIKQICIALIHHVLCVDEHWMESSNIDESNSALYVICISYHI